MVLVVEGAARPLSAEPVVDNVTVVAAAGSGDDTIVDLVRQAHDRRCLVVTADRGLRERVGALGAEVIGPRSLPYP